MKLNFIRRLLFAVETPENIFVGNSHFSLSSSILATHAISLPHGKRASVNQAACWKRRYKSYLSAVQQGVKWKTCDSESYFKPWKYELQPENYLCPGHKVFHLLPWNSFPGILIVPTQAVFILLRIIKDNKTLNAKTSLNITIIMAAQALP